MLLSALTIENFKGIRDPVRIDLKPVTLLFGPNSAGKSTILHALHYAREVFERENTDPDRTIIGGRSLDLGGFKSLVYNHDPARSIRLRFDLDIGDRPLPTYEKSDSDIMSYDERWFVWEIARRAETASVAVEVKWSSFLDKPLVVSYEVVINGERLARIEASDDSRRIYLSFLNLDHAIFSGPESQELEGGNLLTALIESVVDPLRMLSDNVVEFGILGQSSALPKWGEFLELTDDVWIDQLSSGQELSPAALGSSSTQREQLCGILSSLIVGPGELVRDALCRMIYLGPLRSIPSRNHRPLSSPEASRWANGAAAWDILQQADDRFVREVNDWLGREGRFHAGYRIEVKRFKELEADGPIMLALKQGLLLESEEWIREELERLPTRTRLLLRDEASGAELQPHDIGVGISQVLPVIIAALYPKEGTVLMEQPELHIHPAFQVVLGDLFITQSQDRDVCFLIETHSEHLLLRLLRRIRETYEDELPPGVVGLTPEGLAIFYVENSKEGVRISRLEVSEEGDSKGRWPRGFFEERHAEIF